MKEAFIYGSYATAEADARADIELMIIGEINLDQAEATHSAHGADRLDPHKN